MPARNPSDKQCWAVCSACFQCQDKGKYSKCVSCSGRNDPDGRFYANPDVWCQCREGVMRRELPSGRVIIRQYHTNPFKAKFTSETETQDERDWNEYLKRGREIMDDPYWDPIQFNDGTSTQRWNEGYRQG